MLKKLCENINLFHCHTGSVLPRFYICRCFIDTIISARYFRVFVLKDLGIVDSNLTCK